MPIVYASLADMQARYRPEDLLQLSDWDDTGVLDAARIARALADAGALIDGYVSRRYGDRSALPVPPLLTQFACILAFHILHRASAPDGVQKAREQTLASLRDIAAGKLAIDEGQIDALPARPGAIHVEGRKRFSRGDLDASL